jgi:hypothetical protein
VIDAAPGVDATMLRSGFPRGPFAADPTSFACPKSPDERERMEPEARAELGESARRSAGAAIEDTLPPEGR